jgi:membrane protein implicated in regulation of membrane protease activity
MIILWIILVVVAVLLEAATMALVSIWFAAGALAAVVAAALGFPLWVQIAVFLIVSLVLLAATRPLLKKLMPDKYIPTNGELDIGKKAVVIETVDNAKSTGRVKLDGVDWSADSWDGSVIKKDTVVIVKARGTTKLTVVPLKNND